MGKKKGFISNISVFTEKNRMKYLTVKAGEIKLTPRMFQALF